MVQQITEPLNSEYGIAVKVKKDGEYADATITVDGKTASDSTGGWKTVELSSGNTPTTKMVAVDVEAPATLDETLDVVAEAENSFTRPRSVAIEANLSGYLDHDITIKPEDVEVVSVRKRSAAIGEEFSDDWQDVTTQFCFPGVQLTFKNPVWDYSQNQLYCTQKISTVYPAEQDYSWKYFKAGAGNVVETGERTIPLDTKIYIAFEYIQASTKCQYEVVIKFNTHDGFDSKFTLLVQEKDLGYIEIVGNSAEPTPDPEEPTEP